MSRLNVLRHGSLEDATALMDTDEPLTDYELRALVFNLADRLLAVTRDPPEPVFIPMPTTCSRCDKDLREGTTYSLTHDRRVWCSSYCRDMRAVPVEKT